jgi:hypothetical protein
VARRIIPAWASGTNNKSILRHRVVPGRDDAPCHLDPSWCDEMAFCRPAWPSRRTRMDLSGTAHHPCLAPPYGEGSMLNISFPVKYINAAPISASGTNNKSILRHRVVPGRDRPAWPSRRTRMDLSGTAHHPCLAPPYGEGSICCSLLVQAHAFLACQQSHAPVEYIIPREVYQCRPDLSSAGQPGHLVAPGWI